EGAWWVLWWSLLAVGVLSALFWLGTRLRRAFRFQTYVQLACDLLVVSCLSALTGGRASQFVLFFALVVIAGGLVGRMAGGLFAALGACGAFLALPSIRRWLGASAGNALEGPAPRPALLLAVPAGLRVP